MSSPRPAVPAQLKIVAMLFFVTGVLAVLEILIAMTRNRLSLNFGVLGLPIWWGLLRFSRGWRTCALLFLWLGIILLPLGVLIMLTTPGTARIKVFSQTVARVPPELAVLVLLAAIVLLVWQVRVLTRSHIRALFGLHHN